MSRYQSSYLIVRILCVSQTMVERLDYILKPKLDAKELLNVLKKAANKIPSFQLSENKLDINHSVDQIIEKLISGYETSYNSKIISEVFPYDYYCLLGVYLKKRPSTRMDDFPNHVTEKIETLLGKSLGQAVCRSFTTEDNVTAFILNMKKKEILEIIEFANLLAEFEPDYGFVLSEQFINFSEVGNIYKESFLKLLQYRFYFPNKLLLLQQNLPKQAPNCGSFNLDWFTEEIKHERFDSAFNYLKEHTTARSNCYTMDIFEYKSFYGNIIFNITILLGNMEYEVKELEDSKYIYFKSIEDAITAEEVDKLLNQFISDVYKCISSKRKDSGNSNIKLLLDYIHEHYAEPLTLASVAKHFHFNPSYLSSYFAAHNKEGIIEYLNKIRIEEASKLLLKSPEAISEISARVGYSDHSYFCKVFKKIKGLSPSKYRRKNR
ncbi:AraC family transcriptional regulator [Metabacillus arenae]|uniref:Helix-turn-helix domain-containing protein n=1 Tax=Metabacillus arenae TaxID=2771434 RepID=A0A926RWT4_9BACI|nr:helix-turn-helix domain-containing protein [Metabacillus arenae]MBD1379472.1 helix-turn-helix domain-containing protein [Metabacillus arenae]